VWVVGGGRWLGGVLSLLQFLSAYYACDGLPATSSRPARSPRPRGEGQAVLSDALAYKLARWGGAHPAAVIPIRLSRNLPRQISRPNAITPQHLGAAISSTRFSPFPPLILSSTYYTHYEPLLTATEHKPILHGNERSRRHPAP